MPKKGKSPGIDDVLNEYIITYQEIVVPILLRLLKGHLNSKNMVNFKK